MIRVRHVPLISLVAAATLGTSELSGQALTVRAGAAHIGNELIGGVLGGGLLASFPVGSSDTRILVGAEYLAGTSSRIGVPCGGLIVPGTCPPEPLQDWAASASGLVGIRVPAWQGRRVTVSLGGDLGISRVRSRTRAKRVAARSPRRRPCGAATSLVRRSGTRARGVASVSLGAWRPAASPR